METGIISINDDYQVELMSSGKYYPMHRHDGVFYCFRKGRNGQVFYRTERSARKFIAEYMGHVNGSNDEIAISDADVAQVWGDLQAVPSYAEREAIAAKQQALALDAISAIQKEERDVSHSLYAALCGLWLAECGDRDMAEARVVVQARIADMRAFVDSIEVELGL